MRHDPKSADLPRHTDPDNTRGLPQARNPQPTRPAPVEVAQPDAPTPAPSPVAQDVTPPTTATASAPQVSEPAKTPAPATVKGK